VTNKKHKQFQPYYNFDSLAMGVNHHFKPSYAYYMLPITIFVLEVLYPCFFSTWALIFYQGLFGI